MRRIASIFSIITLLAVSLIGLLPQSAHAASGSFSGDATAKVVVVNASLLKITFTGTYTTASGQVITINDAAGGMYYDRTNAGDPGWKQGGDDKKVGVQQGCQSSVSQDGNSFDISLKLPLSGGGCTDTLSFKDNSKISVTKLSTAGYTIVQIGDTIYPSDADPNFDKTVNTDDKAVHTTGNTYVAKVGKSGNNASVDNAFAHALDMDTVNYHDNPCFASIVITSQTQTSGNALIYKQKKASDGTCTNDGKGKKISIMLDSTYKANVTGADNTPVTSQSAGTSSDGSGGSDVDCGAGPWNWFVCSLNNVLTGFISGIDSAINDLLNVSANDIFSSTKGGTNAYHQAWSYFRILATAIIIIAGLIMVVSQALGFEFLDAYTVRKTLPRLLVAIIGISLSWPVLQFIIDLFNTLGSTIQNLMLAPFSSLNGGKGILTDTTAPLILAALGLGPAAVAGAFAIGLIGGGFILATLGIIFLFIGATLLILTIRQVAIVVFVILAPLAIALYILPNTQKGWNFWKDNFFGLMMMYPIVTAFIAAGKIMAYAASSSRGDNPIYGFVAVIAYFVPYFLIPFAFKLATGIIGNIAGMVNDRSKGAIDRLKNARTNGVKKRHERIMNDQQANNRAGRLYRRAGALTTPGSGALGLTRQQRANYQEHRRKHLQGVSDEALKADNGRAAGDDDATALAVQHGMTGSRFVEQYQRNTGRSEAQARAALATMERGFGAQIGTEAMQVAAFKARTASSTAYDTSRRTRDDGTQETQDEANARATAQRINEGASLIQAGLMTAADATAAGKGNRARTDISGAGFGTQIAAFNNAATARSGQVPVDANGQPIAGFTPGQGMNADGAQQYLDTTVHEADPGDILAGNTRTITALAPSMLNRAREANLHLNQAQEALRAGEGSAQDVADAQQAYDRALGQIAGIQDNLNRTSTQKAGMFADLVNGATLSDGNGGQRTVRSAVELAALRPADSDGRQTFLEVRKEYGQAGRNAQEAGAPGTVPVLPEPRE